MYVPGALGVQDVEKLAEPLAIVSLPLTAAGDVHAASLYSVKTIAPPGFKPPVMVALSPTIRGSPTVPDVGLALVDKLDVACVTVEDSPSSLQRVVASALLVSPL